MKILSLLLILGVSSASAQTLPFSETKGQVEDRRVRLFKEEIAKNPCFGVPLKAGEPCNLPSQLSLSELQQLEHTKLEAVSPRLFQKMNRRIETPLIRNFNPQVLSSNLALGKLKVVEFNLERLYKFDGIKAFFSDCDELVAKHLKKNRQITPEEREKICRATTADFYLLNEADEGVCRSGYRSAEELAMRLNMNYAHAMEWFEVKPDLVGLTDKKEGDKNGCYKSQIDANRIKNEQHNVLLSRFPIKTAKRVGLKQCHDWWTDELDKEDGQWRRGSRSALIAEVDIPGSKFGTLAVVVAHLENKTDHACRMEQMQQIIDTLAAMDRARGKVIPVVLGGDMNTLFKTNFDMVKEMRAKKDSEKNIWESSPRFIGTFIGQTLDLIFTKGSKELPCMLLSDAGVMREASPAWEPRALIQPLSDHAPLVAEFPIRCESKGFNFFGR